MVPGAGGDWRRESNGNTSCPRGSGTGVGRCLGNGWPLVSADGACGELCTVSNAGAVKNADRPSSGGVLSHLLDAFLGGLGIRVLLENASAYIGVGACDDSGHKTVTGTKLFDQSGTCVSVLNEVDAFRVADSSI